MSISKKQYWEQKKSTGVPKPLFDASTLIKMFFPKPEKKKPHVKEEGKPFSYKWQKIKEQYTGKTTCMKNGVIVPEKRSDRLEYHRQSGRYWHKPWPQTRRSNV
jgi:hypothetical protein